MAKRTWWLLAVAVVGVMAAEIGVGAVVWRAHVDSQPAVSDDLPYVDQAIAAVVTGAGDGAAVALAGVALSRACHPAALISGGEFTRAAELFVNPGDEDALLSRIAQRLPDDYHAQRPPPSDGSMAPLLADAGHGVDLSVRRLSAGWVVASARTRCTTPARQQPDNAAPPGGSTAVQGLLSALGTRAAQIHQESVPCAGGSVVTIAAISEPTTTGNLGDRLAARLPDGAHPYATTANRVAFRDGHASFIIGASDDATAITVRQTTGC
jgi:hypothetical protein